MSMLKYFFEIPERGKSNKALFDGLRIMEAGERYTKEQEQYRRLGDACDRALEQIGRMQYAEELVKMEQKQL